MAHLTITLPTLQKNDEVYAARHVVLALDGVRSAEFNAETRILTVDYNPLQVIPETIEARLMQNGFPPGEVVSSVAKFVEEMHDAVEAHQPHPHASNASSSRTPPQFPTRAPGAQGGA
jgi:hypothetical protein